MAVKTFHVSGLAGYRLADFRKRIHQSDRVRTACSIEHSGSMSDTGTLQVNHQPLNNL